MRDGIRRLGPLTIEEYLRFENDADRRHEFVAGRLYAMSGTTARHNQIALNVVEALRASGAGATCRAYAIDLKVRAADDRVYYPDVVVSCESHGGESTIIAAPCLIAEVTSPSTRRTDRGEKLDAYLAMPSLRQYLVVERDRRHVTSYVRDDSNEWTRAEIVSSATVSIVCPTGELPLETIYANIELPPRVREDQVDEWEDALETIY
jgi:Uma2 family endonuclease